MASTQTSLHHYFKAKKNSREIVRAKNSSRDVKKIKAEETPTLSLTFDKADYSTPPLTPKRKNEVCEESKRKRRRENDEENGQRTPKEHAQESAECLPATPKSAKKRLLLNQDPGDLSTTAKHKLTPAEIKERLGKCGRLDLLRAKLLSVNQCSEKLREFRENSVLEKRPSIPPSPSKAVHPQLDKFASLEVEVPISPSKSPLKTPTKTPVKAPAYERFQYLVETPSKELVLPNKYRFLKEVFRAVDTVVSLLHNRQEVITYSKLKPAVQEMLRKAFNEQYLGKIKTVFPLAFTLKQECSKNIMNAGGGSGGQYHLTVTANLDYKGSSTACDLMSKFENTSKPRTFKFRKMDSVVLVERRNIFHNSLIDIVKDHHAVFLESLDPPIVSSASNINRWHSSFPLDDVPDIEPSPLPQPPTVVKLETARDVLDKASDLFSINPRMEKAITEAAARTPKKVAPESVQAPAATHPTVINAALKGVSNSILEKIRAKEAAKATRDMTRSTGENKELEMLSRLPEIARIIRNIFITEKKAALPWELVASKVAASYSSMLFGSEVDSHLHLLIKEVPGWCNIHKVRSGIFLKINKNEDLGNVNNKIQAVINERR